jgi:hypothetical protein
MEMSFGEKIVNLLKSQRFWLAAFTLVAVVTEGFGLLVIEDPAQVAAAVVTVVTLILAIAYREPNA